MKYTEGQQLYRVEDRVTTSGYYDYDGDYICTGHKYIDVVLIVFTVDKVTPKGAWISIGLPEHVLRGDRRWVSHETRRVQTSKLAALNDARRRRAYHLGKTEERLELVKRRLAELEKDHDIENVATKGGMVWL